MKFFIFITTALFSSLSYAHSVEHAFLNGGRGVEFRYADGAPLSHAEVKLFMEGADSPFQKCYLDKNGRFSFIAEEGKNYKLIIDDGMGHGKSLNISGAAVAAGTTVCEGGIPIYLKIVSGVAIIWAAAATLVALQQRRRDSHP